MKKTTKKAEGHGREATIASSVRNPGLRTYPTHRADGTIVRVTIPGRDDACQADATKTAGRRDHRIERNHELALAAFMDKIEAIKRSAEAIAEAAGDHFEFAPDTIHWGHVGTAAGILGHLDDALEIVKMLRSL